MHHRSRRSYHISMFVLRLNACDDIYSASSHNDIVRYSGPKYDSINETNITAFALVPDYINAITL